MLTVSTAPPPARAEGVGRGSHRRRVHTAALYAAALSLAAFALGIRFGTFAASGADSYGYVSQADLWRRGALIVDVPLAEAIPMWRNADWALTPFGYRPGGGPGRMVPTYSAGLPMLMAGFGTLGGAEAVYLVVPALGALAVWLTFVLGRRLGGPSAGALAALALLVSPPFLFQLMWPMSDVPAMAWWLLAFVLALRGTAPGAAAAGAAAAAAILTRPNLVVLAVPLVLLTASAGVGGRGRLGRVAAFGTPALAGVGAVAAINLHLYESALASGYGTFSTIYSLAYARPNTINYGAWLVQAQTPFVLLALAAPFLLRGEPRARRAAIAGLACAATVVLAYLFYTPFDHWTYLRFLLPALPILLALAAAGFARIAPARSWRRAAAFGLVAATLAVWGVWHGRAAFRVRTEEARYATAGRFAAALPPSAVILCNQHSGSLRHYAGRVTIRFEWLDPDVYPQAIAALRRLGRPVYVVLDDWEREIFRERYAGSADLAWLDEPPLVVAAGRVYFYAVPPPGS